MFEIIKPNSKFNFVSKFGLTAILSTLLVFGSIVMIATKMKYGVDFRGGAELQVAFTKTTNLEALRGTLVAAGLEGVTAQSIDEPSKNQFLIKLLGTSDKLNEITQRVSKVLKTSYTGVKILKVDIVGPKAGAELRISGVQAMAWAMLAIMVYIGLRFDFKYSPGAIVALFHDITIILGIFSICGVEFTLQTVAALLAVIGYSVNDTVIVYDRVREHEDRAPTVPLADHINMAVNETLSRTLLTSGTTLFVAVAMLFFGGLAIHDFFFAITLGVIIGTYSSIFVAAPVTLLFDKFVSEKKTTQLSA